MGNNGIMLMEEETLFGSVLEENTGRVEQVYADLPDIYVYGNGFSVEEAKKGQAYFAGQLLTAESDDCGQYENFGEHLCIYILLDISGSIPDAYFTEIKSGIQKLQEQYGTEDRIVLCAFGSEVTLAADGSQDAERMQEILDGLNNRDQETLLFSAIDRVADLAESEKESQYRRKVIAVITDGEDFATGKTQSQEAMTTLQEHGLPVYAFCIQDTKKEYINSFSEFARTSGGDAVIFDPEQGSHILTDLRENLYQDVTLHYRADSNQVSNQMETFSLHLPDGEVLNHSVMNNRWQKDQEAPYLTEVQIISDNHLRLTFSEPLKGADALSAYELQADQKTYPISSAAYSEEDAPMVDLIFSEPLHSGEYRMLCNSITDASMEKNPLRSDEESSDAQTGGSVLLLNLENVPKKTIKQDNRYMGIFFLIFAALIALIITVIAVSSKKRKNDADMAPEDDRPQEHRENTDVVSEKSLKEQDFRQHIKVEAQTLPIQVWISRTGMETVKTQWKLGSSLIVGRSSECDICIEDPELSRQHFCLEQENGMIFISDLDSTNGTAVGGIRIGKKRRLDSGCVIEAGTMKFTMRW